jgi:hypothetical protein
VQLRRAVFAYEVGAKTPADAQQIAQVLTHVLPTLTAAERAAMPGLRAQVFLGEILVASGQKAEAQRRLQEVLQQRLPADLRARAEAAMAGTR